MPDRIGKYVIINEVGQGSTGRVFLSHDPYYGRDVAIKLYNIENEEDEQKARVTRKMFFNEAQMMGRLQARSPPGCAIEGAKRRSNGSAGWRRPARRSDASRCSTTSWSTAMWKKPWLTSSRSFAPSGSGRAAAKRSPARS